MSDEKLLVEVMSIRRAAWSILAAFLVVSVLSTIYEYHVLSVMTSDFENLIDEVDFGDEMQVLYESGKIDEVVAQCKVHKKQFPFDVYGFYYCGIAQYAQGNWTAALQDLRRAVEIDPSWEENVADFIKEAELRNTD